MSGEQDSDAVGYGRPPKANRFQKGKSGNPRGRPPKAERSITHRQIRRDILSVTEAQIPSILPGQSGTMSVIQTALWKQAELATKGNTAATRLLMDLHRHATDEHVREHPNIMQNLEEGERRLTEDGAPPLRGHSQRVYNAMRKLTRQV